MDEQLRFGEFLNQQRLARQISARDLAGELGISAPYVSQLENNVRLPSSAVAFDVARFFGFDPEPVVLGVLRQRCEALLGPRYSVTVMRKER